MNKTIRGVGRPSKNNKIVMSEKVGTVYKPDGHVLAALRWMLGRS